MLLLARFQEFLCLAHMGHQIHLFIGQQWIARYGGRATLSGEGA